MPRVWPRAITPHRSLLTWSQFCPILALYRQKNGQIAHGCSLKKSGVSGGPCTLFQPLYTFHSFLWNVFLSVFMGADETALWHPKSRGKQNKKTVFARRTGTIGGLFQTAKHLRPTVISLYGKGYLDGRIVNAFDTEILDIDFDYIQI